MKIWCVDYAGLSYHVSSHLFFTKAEAENFYESRNHCGNYVKMYQVEDIWGWCGRHFNQIILEVLSSRDDGNNVTYIFGLVKELNEAAEHCKLKMYNVDGFWVNESEFVLSVAWVSEDKLIHRTFHFDGRDDSYEYPTIVERRSKWQKC